MISCANTDANSYFVRAREGLREHQTLAVCNSIVNDSSYYDILMATNSHFKCRLLLSEMFTSQMVWFHVGRQSSHVASAQKPFYAWELSWIQAPNTNSITMIHCQVQFGLTHKSIINWLRLFSFEPRSDDKTSHRIHTCAYVIVFYFSIVTCGFRGRIGEQKIYALFKKATNKRPLWHRLILNAYVIRMTSGIFISESDDHFKFMKFNHLPSTYGKTDQSITRSHTQKKNTSP